nr:zinc finger, CCHC-type [Tanacetum cinerariifolium]
MEILLESTLNSSTKDNNYLIHSYRAVCFETFRIRRRRYNLIPAKSRFKTSCSIDKDEYMMKAQKKMHFLLSSMSVVYVLTTPIPEDGCDDATVEQIRKRAKWDNDDYDSLEAKYMAEDASSKTFLVINFTNYRITDSRPVLEKYNELHGILGRFTQHKIKIDEAIQVSCIIDKLPPSWKDFRYTGNGYDKKDKIQVKPDNTEHKTKSVEKSTVKSQQKVKPNKIEAKETKKSKGSKVEGLNLPYCKDV